MACPR